MDQITQNMSVLHLHDDQLAQLTSFKLFKWNNPTAKTAIKCTEGLFLFNIHRKHEEKETTTLFATKFSHRYIFNKRDFSPFAKHVIYSLGLFNQNPKIVTYLAQQISDYIKSCFRFLFNFSNLTSPSNSPINVFVAHVQIPEYPEQEDGDKDEDEDEDEYVDSDDEDVITDFIHEDTTNKIDDIDNVQRTLKLWLESKNCASETCSVGSLIEIGPTLEILRHIEEDEQENREGESGEFVCSICLDEVVREKKKWVKITSCDHVFHSKCLFEWLPAKRSCPCCRSSTFINVSM